MGTPQQFSLKWKNYSHHIVSAFEDLRGDDDLADVTLSCEGRRLRAHKMLLSACSIYFKETFRENPCKHPVVIMKGISFIDLQALVTFMYNGQVNISQDRLTNFLETAELLQIKGLTDMSEEGHDAANKRPHEESAVEPVITRVTSQCQLTKTEEHSATALEVVDPVRSPTPKRKRIGPACFMQQQQQSDLQVPVINQVSSVSSLSTLSSANTSASFGSSGGGSSHSPSTSLAGPSRLSVSSSTGGRLNPETVILPSTNMMSSVSDSDGTESFPHAVVKFEEEEVVDEAGEYEKYNLLGDNESSVQDMLGNLEEDSSSLGSFLPGRNEHAAAITNESNNEQLAHVAGRVHPKLDPYTVKSSSKLSQSPKFVPKKEIKIEEVEIEDEDEVIILGPTVQKVGDSAEQKSWEQTERHLYTSSPGSTKSSSSSSYWNKFEENKSQSSSGSSTFVRVEFTMCSICGVSLPKYAIREHIMSVHNNLDTPPHESEARSLCTHCGKNFKNKNSLKVHRSIYHRHESQRGIRVSSQQLDDTIPVTSSSLYFKRDYSTF